MDIDEARHHHEAAPVDHRFRRAVIAAPDEFELALGKRHVRIGEIDMRAFRFVPGDDAVGAPNKRCLRIPSLYRAAPSRHLSCLEFKG